MLILQLAPGKDAVEAMRETEYLSPIEYPPPPKHATPHHRK